MKFNYLTRIRIISISIFLFAVILIGKLYILQIVDHDVYIQKADRQYQSSNSNIFNRGNIFFQNKDGSIVSAATLQSGFIVAINPEILTNPEDAYARIRTLIPIDHDTFISKASKKTDPYEEIATHVETSIGEKINALNIRGVSVYKERWRLYPGGSTASQTLGILGYKGDEYAGRYGLERQYEKVLSRTDGAYVNFFAEIFANLKKVTSSESQYEGDIVTTIEPTVQNELQHEIASTTDKWNSDYTGGIIMNPKTGEVYALDVYPTFDPNNSSQEKNVAIFSNPLVENVYEMGSIIKPLTIASGIDAGVITAKSTYYDPGFVMINGKKISNFDGKDRGVVDIQEILSQSLNVGAAHVASLLGNERLTEYFYKFGLNEKTNIDLPNEGRNLVDNLKSPRDIEHATASFGQGIALTPISTVRALSVLANNGVRVDPHVVKKINYKIGYSQDVPLNPGVQVIKPETASEVARMMVYSVDNTLQNGSYKLPNYSVAVKTGTAQVAKSGGGGYSDTQILHSFVGFFPAYNPQFFIFLYTFDPKGVKYGSESLSAPFMNIVKFLINYYEIPPDR